MTQTLEQLYAELGTTSRHIAETDLHIESFRKDLTIALSTRANLLIKLDELNQDINIFLNTPPKE